MGKIHLRSSIQTRKSRWKIWINETAVQLRNFEFDEEKEWKWRVWRKSGTGRGRGGSEREGREQNASGNANDRLEAEAFPPRWPMVAALKADGAPETSSKKKDKECRNDGERDPRSW